MKGPVFMSTPKRLLHFWILVRARRAYVPVTYRGIIHTLRRYFVNDSSGSVILVHIIVVLEIGATSYCCLLP